MDVVGLEQQIISVVKMPTMDLEQAVKINRYSKSNHVPYSWEVSNEKDIYFNNDVRDGDTACVLDDGLW